MKTKKLLDAANLAHMHTIAQLVPKQGWLDNTGYINRPRIFQHVTGMELPNCDVPLPVFWSGEPQDHELLAAVDKAWGHENQGAALSALRPFPTGLQRLAEWLEGQVSSAKEFAKVLETVKACENDWVVRNREAVLSCYAVIYLAYTMKANYKYLVHPEVMCFITKALYVSDLWSEVLLKATRIAWLDLFDFLTCVKHLTAAIHTVHGTDEWKKALRGDQMDKDTGKRLVSEFFARYEDGDYDPFLGQRNDLILELIE